MNKVVENTHKRPKSLTRHTAEASCFNTVCKKPPSGMNWESNQREQLKNVMRKRWTFIEVGVHIFPTKNYWDLPSCTGLKSNLQSLLTTHSFLCLAPYFTQLQCHRHSPGSQSNVPEAADLPNFPHPRSPSKKLISQLQIIVMVLPSFIACTPPLLPLFQSSSPSQNNIKEVKPGRPKLQILSWLAPDLHSRKKKKKSLVPSSACDQRWA